MKLLQEFGLAILGLAIFVALFAIDYRRRKYWQRNRKEDV
jgi:hypothetical protein